MRALKVSINSLFLLALILFAPLSFAAQPSSPSSQLSSPAPQQTQRSWLGISILEVDEKVARHMDISATKGLVVVDVVKGGPADDSGLRQGDVIVRLNGREMTDFGEFVSRVQEAGVGAVVVLGVDREGEIRDFKVTLEAMPEEPMVSKGYGMGYGKGYSDGVQCPQHGQMAVGECPMGRDCPMGDDCPVKAGKPCAQCLAGMKGQGYGPGYGQTDWHRSGRGRHYMGMGAGIRHGGTYGPMYGKIKMAIKGMDLTADQRAKISAISSEYRKKAIKAGADAKVAHMELHEMLASDPVNMEKVRAKVNDLAKRRSDMMMSGIRALEDMKKVLTPAQRKSLRETLSMDSMDSSGRYMMDDDAEDRDDEAR